MRYLELLIVADYELYAKFFKFDEIVMAEHILRVITAANEMLETLNLHLVVVGFRICIQKEDTFQGKANISEYFKAAVDYQMKYYSKMIKYDTVLFFSGQFNPAPPSDPVVTGQASDSSICRNHSTMVAVIPDSEKASRYSVHKFATIVVHQLGHVIGMSHDTPSCPCPDKSCIMEPNLGAEVRYTECARQSFELLARNTPADCYQRPDSNGTYPVCGNGYVDVHEECDCHHHDTECKKVLQRAHLQDPLYHNHGGATCYPQKEVQLTHAHHCRQPCSAFLSIVTVVAIKLTTDYRRRKAMNIKGNGSLYLSRTHSDVSKTYSNVSKTYSDVSKIDSEVSQTLSTASRSNI
ncbi:Disintegrin and metalloproteinase domain-containing protein 9 [Halotydeus destructor]|nr:Disintegrin and metalloproteinase domain-containing protein 9 [Halotydeus destructor]